MPSISGTVTVGASAVTFNSNIAKRDDGAWQNLSVETGSGYLKARVYPSDVTPFTATVTVGNGVTIGALPAISGTVTANIAIGSTDFFGDGNESLYSVLANTVINTRVVDDTNSPIGVSANVVSIGGTVTVGAVPNGSLTTRFGTPATANTAFATSAVTNANRKYLLVQNVTTGSNVITVGIGFTPTTTQGIQLVAGAGITFESSYIPTGAVYVLSSVTASNFTILEA